MRRGRSNCGEIRRPARAAGGSPISTMLGSTCYQDTALSVADQGSTDDPIDPKDPTAAPQRLVLDEIFRAAADLKSLVVCVREA